MIWPNIFRRMIISSHHTLPGSFSTEAYMLLGCAFLGTKPVASYKIFLFAASLSSLYWRVKSRIKRDSFLLGGGCFPGHFFNKLGERSVLYSWVISRIIFRVSLDVRNNLLDELHQFYRPPFWLFCIWTTVGLRRSGSKIALMICFMFSILDQISSPRSDVPVVLFFWCSTRVICIFPRPWRLIRSTLLMDISVLFYLVLLFD